MKKKYLIKTQYGSFEAVFEPETDMGGYVVVARTVHGAISWGKNLTHAKKMIIEAIEGAIEAKVIMDAVTEGNVRFTSRAKRIPAFA